VESYESLSAMQAVERILEDALDQGVSDIHIEPFLSDARIRFRVDGLLQEQAQLSRPLYQSVINRLKVMGSLDLGESRLPQDGSCHLAGEEEPVDLRLSLLPSIYGEKAVIRILKRHVSFIENNDLGMLPCQKELFLEALRREEGLILTTGPTGSGKTSTLYAALRLVNRPEVSVVSIEDPVEYRIPGVTQMEVNPRAGLDFSTGLRALMRQDPDVILIGEIRDEETARAAIHAALTGHLVLSSLHTSCAAEAPIRLLDMGIPSYLMEASLSLVLSQRLLACPCPQCHGERDKRDACRLCRGKGIFGRTGVFEMFSNDSRMKEAISHVSEREIKECMKKQGQPDLREAMKIKAAGGNCIS
jgi:type II secretory ATPase GspE/PulE/Tfp pilus assembly ATPase PilB-like protein